MFYLILGIGILLAAVLIGTALQVDDWSRDLAENRAETTENADDVRLRTLQLDTDPEATVELIRSAVESLPGWELVEQANDDSGQQRILRLTRTTKLFRFVDDASVTVEPLTEGDDHSGSKVNAVSQSRVGKGDLGQNPRNIVELFSAIKNARTE